MRTPESTYDSEPLSFRKFESVCGRFCAIREEGEGWATQDALRRLQRQICVKAVLHETLLWEDGQGEIEARGPPTLQAVYQTRPQLPLPALSCPTSLTTSAAPLPACPFLPCPVIQPVLQSQPRRCLPFSAGGPLPALGPLLRLWSGML